MTAKNLPYGSPLKHVMEVLVQFVIIWTLKSVLKVLVSFHSLAGMLKRTVVIMFHKYALEAL